MSRRRKLTDADMAQFRDYVFALAKAANPNAFIQVTVQDEIDENGQVHWLESVTPNECDPEVG